MKGSEIYYLSYTIRPVKIMLKIKIENISLFRATKFPMV